MDIHGLDEFAIPVPVLPVDGVDCEGLLPKCRVSRAVILNNEVGDDIVSSV